MLKSLVKIASLATLAVSLTGCVTPTLSTHIQVDSKFSMTPELQTSLRAMPDWGDKISVVALDAKQADDALYVAFENEMKARLQAIQLEVVKPNTNEKYRMSIGLLLEKTRVVREQELVPEMVIYPTIGIGFGHGFYHAPPPPRRGHRGHRGHPPPPPMMMPHTVMTVQYTDRQYWARGLQIKIDEVVKKGRQKEYVTVYQSTIYNESACKNLQEVLPLYIDAAIQHLYDTGKHNQVVKIEAEGLSCY
ncbi:MAG: hypothetical protein J6V64_00200 [Burkholderiaceae bacterium]|nr:hypothetical protein [Burkholderiaceae bacterium]